MKVMIIAIYSDKNRFITSSRLSSFAEEINNPSVDLDEQNVIAFDCFIQGYIYSRSTRRRLERTKHQTLELGQAETCLQQNYRQDAKIEFGCTFRFRPESEKSPSKAFRCLFRNIIVFWPSM